MTIEAISPGETDECFENHGTRGGCSPCSPSSPLATTHARGSAPADAPLHQNHRTPLVSVQAMTAPKIKATEAGGIHPKGSPRGR